MRIVAAARGIFALSLLVMTAVARPASASDCAGLVHVSLPDTTISVAQSVPAGHFTPPYGRPQGQLPAFCRVAGVIRPTADSYIRFEAWLPTANWNGKYLGVGNGGFAGSIDYNGMAGDLRRGYATAGSDTGHEAAMEDAAWAYRHPEKVKDFGYRALHETTVNAKRLVDAFYGQSAKHSYFDSCSDGGREALMEGQRFPEDFDGILAGAPANNPAHFLTSDLDILKTLYGNPANYISTAKLPAISAAVLAARDAQDGVKDGVLTDPTRCHFDPETLLCKGPESRSCLTAPQITALRKIYAGGRTTHGQQIFPGFMPGGEEGTGGWGLWILGPAPGGSSGALFLVNYFRYMVADDPSWNPLTADVDASEQAADSKTAGIRAPPIPTSGAFRHAAGS